MCFIKKPKLRVILSQEVNETIFPLEDVKVIHAVTWSGRTRLSLILTTFGHDRYEDRVLFTDCRHPLLVLLSFIRLCGSMLIVELVTEDSTQQAIPISWIHLVLSK